MARQYFFLIAIAFLAGSVLAQDTPPPVKDRYPSLRVLTKVGTKRNKVPGSSYRQIMVTSPSLTIESARTQPMAAARATCLIITMDTARKYRNREEVYKVATSETLDIPAVDKGERRDFEFAKLTTQFDSERDYTNVGGDVYKYFLIAVFSDTQEILYFETNNPSLDAYLKKNPDQRLRFLSMKVGASFPSKF